jgi:hypothetical protein
MIDPIALIAEIDTEFQTVGFKSYLAIAKLRQALVEQVAREYRDVHRAVHYDLSICNDCRKTIDDWIADVERRISSARRR